MSPAAPSPQIPEEGEVRDLVARIVDAVLGDEPASTPPAPPATQSTPPPSPAPAPAPAAGQKGTTIAVGADHGGYPLKERLAFKLKEAGHEVVDCGTHSHESVDYPDFALAVAEKVAGGECTHGIVVDGAAGTNSALRVA